MYDIKLNIDSGLYYPIVEKNPKVIKRLVVFAKNKFKTIEVTIEEINLNDVLVSTKSGKKMWVKKKELF